MFDSYKIEYDKSLLAVFVGIFGIKKVYLKVLHCFFCCIFREGFFIQA